MKAARIKKAPKRSRRKDKGFMIEDAGKGPCDTVSQGPLSSLAVQFVEGVRQCGHSLEAFSIMPVKLFDSVLDVRDLNEGRGQ